MGLSKQSFALYIQILSSLFLERAEFNLQMQQNSD